MCAGVKIKNYIGRSPEIVFSEESDPDQETIRIRNLLSKKI